MNVDQQAGGQEQQMLKRIVALLFALATLADIAGNTPMRCLVMWILRRGEISARAFVTELCRDCGVALPLGCEPLFTDATAVRPGDTAADAMRLARSFRTLAAALDNLSHFYVEDWPRDPTSNGYTWLPMPRPRFQPRLTPRVRAMVSSLLAPDQLICALPYPDTS